MEPAGGPDGSDRIALTIQYDGTRFEGSQIQARGRTVQGELERALELLTKRHIRLIFSSRTDSGVHAIEQVAHFEAPPDIALSRLCIGLNGIAERDVSIRNAYRVPADFHARYSAVEREYIYCIHNHPNRSPFSRYRAMWVREPLDVDFLRCALGPLTGEMDYAAFCKKKSAEAERSTVRRISHADVTRWDDHVIVVIRGNAFLHNMIRVIVGTMISLHREGRDPEHMRSVLSSASRMAAGFTAPPYGLYLNRVLYDPPLSSMEAAFK